MPEEAIPLNFRELEVGEEGTKAPRLPLRQCRRLPRRSSPTPGILQSSFWNQLLDISLETESREGDRRHPAHALRVRL